VAIAAVDLLADQHRRAQLALRAATLADLLRIWPAFRIEDISGSWRSLEPALIALIQARGNLSARLAANYFTAARVAAAVEGIAAPRLAPTPTPEEIIPGLRVMGPVNAGRQIAKRRDPHDVADATFVNVSGEVSRQVLDVGRATLVGSLALDPSRPQVRRVTDNDPCKWCSDQASRTYPPTDRFPAHSHCACFPAPVY
jgi:hypothetical protein